MKTKKHKIDVEIPVGKYCDGCEFWYTDDPLSVNFKDVCGLFKQMLNGGDLQQNPFPYRCPQCIEKFGLEEEQ